MVSLLKEISHMLVENCLCMFFISVSRFLPRLCKCLTYFILIRLKRFLVIAMFFFGCMSNEYQNKIPIHIVIIYLFFNTLTHYIKWIENGKRMQTRMRRQRERKGKKKKQWKTRDR